MQAIIGFRCDPVLRGAFLPAQPYTEAVRPPALSGESFWRHFGDRRIRMDPSLLLAAFFPPDDATDSSSREAVDIHNLIRQAQAGDSTAVAALYQLYAGAIQRYMVFRAPSVQDAEDLTAEVFIRMVEGLPSYQITLVPFEAWLYRIASARIADFYRRAKRNLDIELFDIVADREMLPEERVIEAQLLETVRAALHQLSEEHQTILVLRFVERKSHEEVAEILNKSMTAVKSAQHRALHQLTSLLGSDQKIRHYLRGQND